MIARIATTASILTACAIIGGGVVAHAQTGKKNSSSAAKKKGPVAATRDGSRLSPGGRATPPPPAGAGRLREWPFVAGEGAFVPASNGFGFRLLAQLSSEKGKPQERNVFFSPVGISLALGLTANGAAGETRAAIVKTVGLDPAATPETTNDLAPINRDAQKLTARLAKATPHARLAIANAIWSGQGRMFTPGFVSAASSAFDATATGVDFSQPSGVETVNRWVSDMTSGKIKTLLAPEDVDEFSPVVLTNAVYFKGKWNEPFAKKATQDGPFTLASGEKKMLPMMTRTGPYPYLKGERFQAISLPYDDGRFSLYVVLPDAGVGLSEFQSVLTVEQWNQWLPKLAKTSVQVQIPRFALGYDTSLNAPLRGLGMGIAFAQKDADFTPMLGESNLFVGLVKHKTTLAVDEEGTEATAATAVVMKVKDFKVSRPAQFIVDRPFLCAIRDNETGTLVFLGSVFDPERKTL